MIIKTLFFPGQYEDAYLYKGKLFLLTADMSLAIYDFDAFIHELGEKFAELRQIPKFMFTHYEWLSEPLLQSLFKGGLITEAILEAFSKFPNIYEITEQHFISSHKIDIYRKASLLDIAIYNSRLFIGTNSGFYHLDFDVKKNMVEFSSKVITRHEARCVKIAARYNAINISCVDDGLFTSFNEFLKFPLGEDGYLERGELPQTSPKSIAAEWFKYDLINYPTPVELKLLQSVFPEHTNDDVDRGEKRSLNTYKDEIIELDYLLAPIVHTFQLNQSDVRYIHNSEKNLFVQTFDSNLYSINISNKRQNDSYMPTSRGKPKKYVVGQILNTVSNPIGTIFETYDEVVMLANGELYKLLESQVLGLRTFPQSRNYKNIVAATTEDGVFIIGLVNPDLYTS